jgi:hypothetical protein
MREREERKEERKGKEGKREYENCVGGCVGRFFFPEVGQRVFDSRKGKGKKEREEKSASVSDTHYLQSSRGTSDRQWKDASCGERKEQTSRNVGFCTPIYVTSLLADICSVLEDDPAEVIECFDSR